MNPNDWYSRPSLYNFANIDFNLEKIRSFGPYLKKLLKCFLIIYLGRLSNRHHSLVQLVQLSNHYQLVRRSHG